LALSVSSTLDVAPANKRKHRTLQGRARIGAFDEFSGKFEYKSLRTRYFAQ
jgi:hypothetical protein